MPEVTNELAVSGFSGLTVVLANRKETAPAKAKKAPTKIKPMTELIFIVLVRAIFAVNVLNHHIPAAITKATKGGGILFSRNFISVLNTLD